MADSSPIMQLVESLKKSERLRSIAIGFGANEMVAGGAPQSVILVPVSEEYEVSEHDGNLVDAPLLIELHCWGKTFDATRDVRNRVVQAVFDFQLATDLLKVRFDGGKWDTSPDTEQQGTELVITMTVRDVVERVPLKAESFTGDIDEIDFQPEPTA